MNFRKFFFIVGLAWLLNVTNMAQPRGVGVKVKNDAGQTQDVQLYDASYALVIGASGYHNGWQKLPGVKTDAGAVRDALNKHGFTVEELADPTGENLLPSINRFVNKYGLTPNNRILIYFAGHGYTETAADGRKFGYIVPVDAPAPAKDLTSFQQQAVTMDDIETVARKIRSKHALFVFDSCFSGTLLNARRGGVPPVILMKATQPVRQFITAGAADQEVPDVSIFRRQFVEGIAGEADRNSDGYVTGSELADYLQEKVTNYTRGSQTPQYGKIFDSLLDKGDFIFVVSGKNAGANSVASQTPKVPQNIQPAADVEAQYWTQIEKSSDAKDFEEYLREYPQGRFSPLARQRLRQLGSAKTPSNETSGQAQQQQPPPSEKPKFADYVGEYESAEGTVRIYQEGDKLFAMQNMPVELKAGKTPDEFSFTIGDASLTFRRDSKGKVIGLLVAFPDGMKAEARKIK